MDAAEAAFDEGSYLEHRAAVKTILEAHVAPFVTKVDNNSATEATLEVGVKAVRPPPPQIPTACSLLLPLMCVPVHFPIPDVPLGVCAAGSRCKHQGCRAGGQGQGSRGALA